MYVVWADSSDYHTWLSVIPAAKLAACNQSTDDVAATADGEPTVDSGASTPVQVDRDAVRTTVFPWVAAGGAPGRVAVAFYGTTSDGDPNSGDFKGSCNVYVNQSLNALDSTRTFSQVSATTHPFHYDSICLNGLGCDIAVPAGDRTLADFFAIGYNPADGRLSVVYDRDNKKPDESLGHVATPMVATRIAALGERQSVTTTGHATVRSSSTDPAGDALSSYSLTAPAVAPPDRRRRTRRGRLHLGVDLRRTRRPAVSRSRSRSRASRRRLWSRRSPIPAASPFCGSGASRTATRTRPRACAGTRCRGSRSGGTTTRPAVRHVPRPRTRRARSASSIRAVSRCRVRSTS